MTVPEQFRERVGIPTPQYLTLAENERGEFVQSVGDELRGLERGKEPNRSVTSILREERGETKTDSLR